LEKKRLFPSETKEKKGAYEITDTNNDNDWWYVSRSLGIGKNMCDTNNDHKIQIKKKKERKINKYITYKY
jgi:hypothetical protein